MAASTHHHGISARLSGWLYAVLAIITFCSLISYSPSDPSFNNTFNDVPQNLMGVTGSYLADLMLQVVGAASALLVAALGIWAWRCLRSLPLPRLWFRVMMLCITLPAAALLLTIPPTPISWPVASGLGGYMGYVLNHASDGVIPSVLTMIVSLVVTIVGFMLATGLPLSPLTHMRTIWGAMMSGLHWPSFSWLQREREALVESTSRAPRKKRQRQKKQPLHDAPNSPVTIEKGPSIWRDERPAKEAKKSTSATKTQDELTFGDNPAFSLPSLTLLAPPKGGKKEAVSETKLRQQSELLESVLNDFGVYGTIAKVRPGPVVTLYELEPAPGTKSSRVIGLADDIARSMSAVSARIAVVPGVNAIGIELPNASREMVNFRELLEAPNYADAKLQLPLALGKDIGGDSIMVDLAKMPHLLVAGTTGSGKSVAVNAMILSLLYRLSPEQCRFIMIDPKMLELSVYDGIPHLLSPVVTEPGKAVVALKWIVREMENRYRLMSNLGVRNIHGYNQKISAAQSKGEVLRRRVQTGFNPEDGKPVYEEVDLDMNPLPYIVVIVDEMADLMVVAGKDIEGSVQRLAQMARAAGIHIIMATQRPSVDVITGVIKANFPTRISFQVTSKIDSRTILGEQGAEQLLGMGDMLYMSGGSRIMRVHGAFVSDKEVEEVVNHLKRQGQPDYIEDITQEDAEPDAVGGGDMSFGGGGEEGDLYQRAVQIVLRDKKASTSYVQRRLKIGYNRAASLIERMEEEGIVGPANHVGKREILLTSPAVEDA